MNDFTTADEALAYLRYLIDPRDPLNPRYAAVQRCIDAIIKAKVDVIAFGAVVVYTVSLEDWERLNKKPVV